MDVQEVGCGGMDWIEPAQGRGRWRALVNAVIKLYVYLYRKPIILQRFEPEMCYGYSLLKK
jgi:hypothetical protein